MLDTSMLESMIDKYQKKVKGCEEMIAHSSEEIRSSKRRKAVTKDEAIKTKEAGILEMFRTNIKVIESRKMAYVNALQDFNRLYNNYK